MRWVIATSCCWWWCQRRIPLTRHTLPHSLPPLTWPAPPPLLFFFLSHADLKFPQSLFLLYFSLFSLSLSLSVLLRVPIYLSFWEKMGQPRPLLLFSNTYFTEIIVGFSWIWTRIVGIEGENADHLTTTTARLLSYLLSSNLLFTSALTYCMKLVRYPTTVV